MSIIDIADVRRALDNDEMVPCFQPLIELHSLRLTGFEVLARWRHPQLGLILPDNFISLAEEHGLIAQLMRQILHKTFLSVSILPDTLRIAVNVSPVQLRDSSLPTQIHDEAEKSGFPLGKLTIEITESAFVDNIQRAQEIAHEIKAMGCRLALDDFGTGFSCLGHLQTLPFDELKIDRSFVASMTHKRESRKIVAAILGLGRSLGLVTLAEGVETKEQAEMLLRLGCELGQGWLYGWPVPGAELCRVIEDASRAALACGSQIHDVILSSLEALPTQRLAQLQAIYDGAPVGLCFLDTKLRYVSINMRLAAINGSTVEAHLGRTMSEMVPVMYTSYEPYLVRALDGEAIGGVEITQPSVKLGEPQRMLLSSYQPAWDEAEEVIGISVSVVDITEHTRIEEAIHTTGAQSDQQDALSIEMPWIMDAKGDSLLANAHWIQTARFRSEETHNLAWLKTLHTEDLDAAMNKITAALRSGQSIDMEYRVRDLEDGWRWVRSRGSPRFGPEGQITRWYGNVVDINARKRLEETLRTSKTQLPGAFDTPLADIIDRCDNI